MPPNPSLPVSSLFAARFAPWPRAAHAVIRPGHAGGAVWSVIAPDPSAGRSRSPVTCLSRFLALADGKDSAVRDFVCHIGVLNFGVRSLPEVGWPMARLKAGAHGAIDAHIRERVADYRLYARRLGAIVLLGSPANAAAPVQWKRVGLQSDLHTAAWELLRWLAHTRRWVDAQPAARSRHMGYTRALPPVARENMDAMRHATSIAMLSCLPARTRREKVLSIDKGHEGESGRFALQMLEVWRAVANVRPTFLWSSEQPGPVTVWSGGLWAVLALEALQRMAGSPGCAICGRAIEQVSTRRPRRYCGRKDCERARVQRAVRQHRLNRDSASQDHPPRRRRRKD